MSKVCHICINPNAKYFYCKGYNYQFMSSFLLCYSNFPQISILLTERKRFRGRAEILRRTDVRIKYKSERRVKEIDNERRRNLCDVRDKENRTRIFSL